MDKGIVLCLILGCVLILLFVTTFTGKDVIASLNEKSHPLDRIRENQIKLFPDKIVIYINNSNLVSYSDTHSMNPTIDYTTKGIEIVPTNPEQIQVGDIIAFRDGSDVISHRVVSIDYDEQGWFCKVKGDNDPIKEKVRFSQIIGVVVVLIY